MMQYKGYVAEVEYDAEAETLHGRVKNIQDVITFEGLSVEELKREFEASVDEYLELCREMGDEPDRPYSGRFVVRIDPNLHRHAAICAARQGMSLNALATRAIQNTVDRHLRPKARVAGHGVSSVTIKAVVAPLLTVPAVPPPVQPWPEGNHVLMVGNVASREDEQGPLPC